ncbi:MAG: Wzy polymerase domain-containing protein [Betaproteobacteria bacterium]|nr:Wzy polymerase domain-containing protein [Betaproteobacteria bacterium]
MFVVPFLLPYHRFPLTSYFSEWLALVLGIGALTVLWGRRSREGLALPRIALLPLALAAILGVQAVLGMVPYAGQALAAIAYLVWASALIVLAAVLEREAGSEAIVRVLAWSLVVGGLLSALAALIQHYYGSSWFIGPLVARKSGNHEVYGNLGQRGHFANYITLALFSVAYLRSRQYLRWGAALVLCLPMLFVLGLSGSRIAWLFLLWGVGLSLAMWLAQRGSRAIRGLAACLGMTLIGFVGVQEIASLSSLVPAGGAITATERLFAESTGPSERIQLWTESWWAFLRAPVFGWGWGGFPTMHFEYQAGHTTVAGHDPYHQAHNLVLQLMVETGAAGTLLVVGGTLAWLWGLRRQIFSLERWWQLAVLGVLAVHSMSEFPLWYSYFLGVTAILLGLGGAPRAPAAWASSLRPLVAALSVLGSFYLVYNYSAYRDFERIFVGKGSGLEDHAAQSRGVARALSDPILRPYGELAIAFSTAVEPDRVAQRLALVRRASRFAPYYPIVYKQAMLLAMAGEQKAAVDELVRAKHVYPQEWPPIRAQITELAARYPGRFEALLSDDRRKHGEE